MRGLAGGVAGGFLGSMLFSSLGHAAGTPGAGGSGGSGGIGFLEILLIGGLAFVGFKWWKNRQAQAQYAAGGSEQRFAEVRPYQALEPAGIDPEAASDIFFKIQGAWTRRDLASVHNHLQGEMQEILEKDLSELKQKKQINRLENITVRRTEVKNSWEEDRTEYSTVQFTANLLDYTVDEESGKILDGNDTEPVKFDETWVFAKPIGSATWRLSGIQQS